MKEIPLMAKLSWRKFLKRQPPEYREAWESGMLHNYTIEKCADKIDIPQPVLVSDTTCRDGEQMPGVFFTPEQKLEIVQKLKEVGIFSAEVGYPAVSDDEMKACKLIIENKAIPAIYVMARAKKSDIDAAMKCDAQFLNLFTSTSEYKIRHDLGLTPEQNIEMYLEHVDYAVDHGLTVGFGREDDSRAHLDYYIKFMKLVMERAGSKFLGSGISDTTGSLTPCAARWLVKEIRKELPTLPLLMHFHNDFGMATANTLAGIEAGANGVNGTVLGIGERCGNTPIEEVIIALRGLYGINIPGIKYEKLMDLCKLVSKYSGIPIHVSKPVCGMNAFRHESGIHAHGVLVHPLIYEPYPHAWLGRESEFIYGKFSGTAVVLQDALEKNDIHPTKEQLIQIVLRVKDEQIRRGKEEFEKFTDTYQETMRRMGLSIEEVLKIAQEVLSK